MFENVLNSIDLLELKEKLDSQEEDMYFHDYKLDDERLGFLCKEICLFNQLVHEKLGIPYHSTYENWEPN